MQCGRCDFQQFGGNGSFSIGPIGQPFIAGRLVLSVTLVSPETAEVRGLTQDGINSRWGPARRSARDRACWDGSDFQICAY